MSSFRASAMIIVLRVPLRLRKLEAVALAKKGPHVMVRLIARVIGIGIETADMLVNEIRIVLDGLRGDAYGGECGGKEKAGAGHRRNPAAIQRTTPIAP